MVSTFQMLAFTDKLNVTDALKVTGIGLLVVFSVLAIIIVLIEALHAAFKEKKNDVPKEAPVQTPAPKEEKRISPGVMAEVPEASDADKDGDLIAAISAVITCATGHSDFKIKSIKKG